jgi:hypothetical protein
MPIFTRPPATFKAFPIYYDHSRHLYVHGNQTYNHEVEEAEIYQILPPTMHLKNERYRARRKVCWSIHSAVAVSHEDLEAIWIRIEQVAFRYCYKQKYKCRYSPSRDILIVTMDLVSWLKDYINPKYLLYFGAFTEPQILRNIARYQTPPNHGLYEILGKLLVAHEAIDGGGIVVIKFIEPEMWEGPPKQVISCRGGTVKGIIDVSYGETRVAIIHLLGLPLCDGVEDIGDDNER